MARERERDRVRERERERERDREREKEGRKMEESEPLSTVSSKIFCSALK